MLTDHSKKMTTDWLIRTNIDTSCNVCNHFVNRRVLEAHTCVFGLIEDILGCISSLRSSQGYTVDQIICAVYGFRGIFLLHWLSPLRRTRATAHEGCMYAPACPRIWVCHGAAPRHALYTMSKLICQRPSWQCSGEQMLTSCP